jgi:hypothetical protein
LPQQHTLLLLVGVVAVEVVAVKVLVARVDC